MTLSQALLCIDKDYCRKIAISVEFGDGSRSEVFKFSPIDINGILSRISPLSRVLAFLDRKGSVNIVVAFTAQPDLEQQIYDELSNILYLYKNDNIHLTAEVAAQSVYKIIKKLH